MHHAKLLLPVLLALACARPHGDPKAPSRADDATHAQAATIDRDRMFAVVQHLASDDLRGRYTLNPDDIGRAAAYLADAYRQAGIAPVASDYLVSYDVVAGTQPGPDLNLWLEVARDPHAIMPADAVAIANGGGEAAIGDAVFAGRKGSLRAVAGAIAVAWPAAIDASTLVAEVDRLVEAGARGVLLVAEGELPVPGPLRSAMTEAGVAIPVAIVRRAVIADRIAIAPDQPTRALADARVSMAARREDLKRPAPNVLAYVPGTDLAHEIVIVGAHYDHIGTHEHGHFCRTRTVPDRGIDGVCNGADDNASGTAGVLEVARALAQAGYRPRRSIVFAHFSGEELGLFGSGALASTPPNAPPFSGGRVVAMINMDMIGRLGGAGLSIGGLSSSEGWRPLLDAAGDRGLPIVYERAVTSRSDHAHWYRKKIPVLFFFTGLHEDYHGPGDEADRINIDGMTEIVSIVLDVTRGVADGAKLQWSEPRSAAEGEVARLPGSDPATVEPPASGRG